MAAWQVVWKKEWVGSVEPEQGELSSSKGPVPEPRPTTRCAVSSLFLPFSFQLAPLPNPKGRVLRCTLAPAGGTELG